MLQRIISLAKTKGAFVFFALLASGLVWCAIALWQWQGSHPKATQAAMPWSVTPIATNDLPIVNMAFDQLDANTMVASFVNTLNNDVLVSRTDDGGQTWTRTVVETAIGSTIEDQATSVDIVDTNTIFVGYITSGGTEVRFASSTDGGANWTPTSVEVTSSRFVYIDALDGTNVSVAYSRQGPSQAMVAVTNNGGSSFAITSVYGPDSIADVRDVQMLDVNTIVAVYLAPFGIDVGINVAQSTDGGATYPSFGMVDSSNTFQERLTLASSSATDLAFCYQNSSGDEYIAVSPDAGATFNPVLVEASGGSQARCAVDMLSANDIFIVYNNGTNDFVATTANGGTSWNYYFQGINDTNLDIRFTTPSDGFLVFSEYNGAVLQASTDGGAQFFKRYAIEGAQYQFADTAFVDTGNPLTDQNHVFQALFDVIGRDLHVAYTHDSGTNWVDVNIDGSNGDSMGQYPSIWAVDENTVFALYHNDETGDIRLSSTTDGGSSWTPSVVTTAVGATAMSVHSLDGTTVHVVYDNSSTSSLDYMRSVDGGATFPFSTQIASGVFPLEEITVRAINANDIYASYIDPTIGDIIFAYSNDGGASWSTVVIDNDGGSFESELAMDVVDVNTVYIAAYNGILQDVNLYSSFDAGANWFSASVDSTASDAGQNLSIDAYDADRVFLGYRDATAQRFRVGYTTNAGFRSFVQIPDQENFTFNLPSSGIHVYSPEDVFTVYNRNVFPLFVLSKASSVDDWEQVIVDTSSDMGVGSDIVAASASRIYTSYQDAANQDLLFASSTDSGANWTTLVVDGVGENGFNTSIDAPDINTIFISEQFHELGPDNDLYVYQSTDGGANFTYYGVEVNDVVNGATAISAESASVIYLAYNNAADGNIYVANSTDGGINWSPVYVDVGTLSTANAIDSLAPGLVALVYRNISGNPTVAVSTDGGLSWPTITEITTGVSPDYSALTLLDATTIDVAYINNGASVYHARSTDAGSSWVFEDIAPSSTIASGAGLGIDSTDVNHVFISFRDDNGLDQYLGQTSDAGGTWNLTVLGQDDHGLYSSVSAADNEHLFVSGYAPTDQEFRVYRTIAPIVNVPPVVGYVADNTIPAAQVVQAADGSGIITVTFKVRDDDANDVSLKDFEYSTNSGGAWTPVLITSPALFGGWPDNAGGFYPTNTSFGSTTAFSFRVDTRHADLVDLNTLSSSTVRFRLKANDGTDDSAFAQTDDFIVDNSDPFVSVGVDLVSRPTSGDTTVTIDGGSVVEDNANSNAFQVAKNGGAYGNVVNGPANTINPIQETTLNTWNYTTLDTLGNLGEGMDSYVADTNNIYILYHDTFVQRLRLARSTDGGDTFTLSDVDTINVGSSVNVAGFGLTTMWATYYDATNGDLKLAYTIDSGDNWTISTIDSTDDVGRATSLQATSANDLFVSYYDVTNGDLKFGVSADAGSNWTFSTVDSTDDVGRATSLDTVDGVNIYIAYEDVTNHDVKLAVSSDSGANFTISTVASTDDVGSYLSLESPNATTVYLAFYNATSGDAEFAVSTDSGNTFTPTTIDTVNDVGRFVSMQSNGTTAIFVLYYDYTSRVMKIARSFNGGTSFTTSFFDPFQFFGTYPVANVLSDSTVYVPYRGDDNNVVYFKKTFDAGANYTTATSVDIAANIGAAVSPVRFLDSDTIVSTYYSYNVGDYVYARSTDSGSSFALSDIETAGNVGGYNELKIIDDLTYVGCYRDQGIGSLRFSKTTDAGASWNTVLVDGAGLQGRQCSITVVNASTYYISAGSDATQTLYFYSSTDGGTNWSRVSVDSPGDYARYTSIGTSNNGATVFIAYHLNSGSFAKFARSTDSGATWSTSTIEANAFYTSMVNFNDIVYVVWTNLVDKTVRVAKSIDGGVNWSITTADTFPSRATLDSIDGYDANHIFFTYNDRGGNLLKMGQTTDGGASWIMSVVDDTGKAGFTSSVDSFDANTLGVMYQALENNDLRFANSVGQVFDGDDVISKVRVTHQDDFGNSTVNENMALSAALATVMPLVPPAPTITPLTTTSLNLVVNRNAAELGDVEYSIRFVSAGPTTEYVQAGGTLGGSPYFQTRSAWGGGAGITVTGLIAATNYIIDTNARNPNGDNPESAYGADATFPPPQGGSAVTRLTVNAPTPTTGTPISPTSIRWGFADNANNEAGFRLINNGQTITTVDQFDLSFIEETNLTPNTLYSGRQVQAFVGPNNSALSGPIEQTATLLPDLSLAADATSATSVTVRISTDVPESTIGQTAFRFERLAADALPSDMTEWATAQSASFGDLTADTEYYVRVQGRNQLGVETNWSQPLLVRTISGLVPAFTFDLSVAPSDGALLRDGVYNPYQKLGVTIFVKNIGTAAATNVLSTLPLPDSIDLVPNSLFLDGRKQTAAADTDNSQSSGHAVSSVWGSIQPGDESLVRFQLAFNIERLKQVAVTESLPIERVIAQAMAAASYTLQASLTYLESPSTQYSAPTSISVSTAPSDLEPPVAPVTPPPAPLAPPAPIAPTAPSPTAPISVLPPVPGTTPTTIGECLSSPVTDSSYDGASFNIVVQACSVRLELVGTATVYGEQIQFAGTTSEPFSFVTITLNGSITVIAVSDARGEWRTFVDADQLGLQPGGELTVGIDASAAKGDLQSQLRPAGQVRLSRARQGEVVADFQTVVSDSSTLTFVNELAKKTAEVMRKQEPALQTTLTVSIPVVVASSIPLWGYLPYIPTLIYHFIGWLVGFIGRRRKQDEQQNAFGIVYDSITKLPLPLAIVRIYNKDGHKLAATIVTDTLGRYDALLPVGTYQVEVHKPQYQFPSSIVTIAVDADYNRVYRDETGFVVTADSSAAPHIPIDPINVRRQWELTFGLRKAWLAFQRFGNHVATPIMIVGLLTSFVLAFSSPQRAANWIIVALYAITLASQMKLKQKLLRAWGVVYDMATDAILPLVTIQLIQPESSKVVSSRLTDYEGRFTFLPEPGRYVVKATKSGYEQVTDIVQGYKDRQPLPSSVHIEKPNQRISGDVAMRAN